MNENYSLSLQTHNLYLRPIHQCKARMFAHLVEIIAGADLHAYGHCSKFKAWGLAFRAMLIESSCKLAAFRRASKYRAGDRKIGCIQLWRNPAGASQRTQTNRNFLLRGTCQSGWLRKTFIQLLLLCLFISTLYSAV
jgi:hypothetical protein